MKPPSKWEMLLELEAKPKPLVEQLLLEAAKLLAAELGGPFPPETGGFEHAADELRFAPLLEEPRTRPEPSVFRAAFHLARLELAREFDELDLYVRTQRYLPLAPTERDRLAMLFLARWLTEQLFALKEHLVTPLSRPQLGSILEQAELRLLGPRN